MEKTYLAVRGPNGADVTIEGDGDSRTLPWCLDLRNLSPTGFNWGYGGCGPAQLALALLCDVTKNDRLALLLYQAFKWDRIAPQTADVWSISAAEVRLWVASYDKAVLDCEVTIGDWNDGLFLDDGLDQDWPIG